MISKNNTIDYRPIPTVINGTNGADGVDGLSAYEIAVANGFVGTEQQWLDSLSASSNNNRVEIEVMYKTAYFDSYKELTYVSGNIAEIGVWTDASKITKLFTKTITYINGSISSTSLTDEDNGNTLIKNFDYLNGNLQSVTTEYTGS